MSAAQPSAKSLTKQALDAWFAGRGWKPFKFQREVWKAIADGRSGLLHATTGAGKTYAVWLGALMSFSTLAQTGRAQAATKNIANPATVKTVPLTVLWITPMRALAADTLRALQQPLAVLNGAVKDDEAPRFIAWSAGARSGDTATAERSAQNQRLPSVLVTTPESLSLLLARADAKDVLGSVRMVVVDEWHELLGNKRGVQVQLALARLKHWNPALCIWGMSATLGNLTQAMHTLLGHDEGVLVQSQAPKKLVIDSLLPHRAERFPWGGHLGLTMLPQVIEEIAKSSTTLVFTNTRSQAEIWYQAMLEARPDWAGVIALHHGSLDRAVREWVELSLKSGALKAVVCTSSLDLGVDFLPVERVLQIGSPKGVARLLQRAGRSGHAPGRPSRVTLVPTHSIEMVEGLPHAQRLRRAMSRRAPRPSSRSMCWCSTWSRLPWAAALFPTPCTTRCAARRRMQVCLATTGSGACPSWRRAGQRWRCTPTTGAPCLTGRVSGAFPTPGWRGATA